MLRPLGDHILIKPIPNPTETESGLTLVEHRKPETMGEVIAVGPCPHPLKAEAEEAARGILDIIDTKYSLQWDEEIDAIMKAAALLRDITQREPPVKAGDLVIFPWTAGREVQLDDTGDRYLLMRESDVLAVLEE